MEVWQKYLNRLPTQKAKIVADILNQAVKFAPDADKAMPYGVPGLTVNQKPLIAVAAHKNHYGVYPFSPKVIKALESVLKI
jgi:uncharacterized protein YdhG (YjbR/CyaY superfamily)